MAPADPVSSRSPRPQHHRPRPVAPALAATLLVLLLAAFLGPRVHPAELSVVGARPVDVLAAPGATAEASVATAPTEVRIEQARPDHGRPLLALTGPPAAAVLGTAMLLVVLARAAGPDHRRREPAQGRAPPRHARLAPAGV